VAVHVAKSFGIKRSVSNPQRLSKINELKSRICNNNHPTNKILQNICDIQVL